MQGHTCTIDGARSHESETAQHADGTDQPALVASPAAALIAGSLGRSLTPRQVLALQGAIGNRTVARLLHRQSTAPQTIGGTVPPVPTPTPGARAVAAARSGDWVSAAGTLVTLDMASLLDALEEFRKAGMLQQLSDVLSKMPIINRPQLKAGVLAVGAGLGFRLSAAEAALTQADRDAIRTHIASRLLAGDVDAPRQIKRWDGQTFSVVDANVTDISWIERFLEFFGFGPPPIHDPTEQSARFNQQWTTVDEVMDLVKSQAAVDGRTMPDDQQIRDTVKHVYQEGRGKARGRQFSITVTFVPATGHTGLSSRGLSVDKPATQYTGSLIWQFHHADDPGLELSVVAQVTMFKDPGPSGTYRVQNVVAGGQAAWVVPFAQGWLQAQAFVQVLGGLAYSGDTRSFNASTVQGAAGGQIAVFPGGQSTFYVALQGTTGFTGTYQRDATAQKTWDWGGGLVVGVQW